MRQETRAGPAKGTDSKPAGKGATTVDFGLAEIEEMLSNFERTQTALRQAMAMGEQLNAMFEGFERINEQATELGRLAERVAQMGEEQTRRGRDLADLIARTMAGPASSMASLGCELSEAVEEIDDASALRAAREAVDEGDEEGLPLVLVKRLEAGEHPVKVYRERRGMTQSELAEAVGLGPGYLSQIETFRRAGSTKTQRKLAEALAVELDDLTPWDRTQD